VHEPISRTGEVFKCCKPENDTAGMKEETAKIVMQVTNKNQVLYV